MKKTIIQVAIIAITATASWISSGYYCHLKPLKEDPTWQSMTPIQATEFRSNVALWARAEITPHDELILGMAHMAFLTTMIEKTKGAEAANSNRLAVIRGLFQMYTNKNWGTMTEIVDHMKTGILENPAMFPGMTIEQGHPEVQPPEASARP